MDTDILDGILGLEDDFYREGYDLGLADGARAGYTEGSVFAVENSFEKLLQLGKLYGKALVWNQRLISSSKKSHSSDSADDRPEQSKKATMKTVTTVATSSTEEEGRQPEFAKFNTDICNSMPPLHEESRLARNIQTLLALVDPATLVLINTEDAVSDIEERLKGASLKAKLIQRALGESTEGSISGGALLAANSNADSVKNGTQVRGDGSGSIEDISSLHIRH